MIKTKIPYCLECGACVPEAAGDPNFDDMCNLCRSGLTPDVRETRTPLEIEFDNELRDEWGLEEPDLNPNPTPEDKAFASEMRRLLHRSIPPDCARCDEDDGVEFREIEVTRD